MDELAALTQQAGTSVNPMASALDKVKSITGGDAGPSSASQGAYTGGSLTLNAGVNMGNGIENSTIIWGLVIAAVAYVYVKRK